LQLTSRSHVDRFGSTYSREHHSALSAGVSAALAWRSQIRKDLVQRRLAAGAAERAAWSTAIDQHLLRAWPNPPGRVIAFCWPYKAAHDVRTVIERWIPMGALAAMPVVVIPTLPLIFRRWHAGALEPGALGRPAPSDGPEIRPDTILLPANGFDASGYRLGYGAGYFERTIAALRPNIRVIGIAYEIGRLPSIRPQSHDEPMDVVVTEKGVHDCVAGTRAA